MRILLILSIVAGAAIVGGLFGDFAVDLGQPIELAAR
jgi:hypothetical protein